ncbi:HAD-IIA family hydrolase [Paenibacillus sp. GCM10027626]|uniref:HAD-IIA family hydrolase n=1 Tax=Paenibacillus sp. GCM10027626 TaxID=3273411 RepID=UPI00363CE605
MVKDLRYAVWLFDLDGTLYFGEQAAPGAQQILTAIRSSGGHAMFITNNSRHSSQEISKKLEIMGIEAPASDIVTATEATGKYLKEQYGEMRVAVAGSGELHSSLQSLGHAVTSLEDQELEAIVVGLDTAFSYDKLEKIVDAVGRGARLIAANSDLSHPGRERRKVPETGALAAAVEAASGIKAEYVGKPAPHLFRYALALSGYTPEQGVMVGDNYNTDIIGGKSAGLATIWVKAENVERDAYREADLIVADLPELNEKLRGGDWSEL